MSSRNPSRPVHPALCQTLVVLMWASWFIMFAKYAIMGAAHAWAGDYDKHYLAALDILQNRNPYPDEGYLNFNYPLMTGWLYLFLPLFSFETAERVWDGLNALLVAASLVLVIRYYRPSPAPGPREKGLCPAGLAEWIASHWAPVSALLLALCAPAWVDLFCRNVEPLNLALLVWLGAMLMRGRERLAAVPLALLCLVKIAPILLVPALFVAGKRKTVWVWAVLMGLYAAVLLVTGWWRWEWFLYTETLPNIGYRYYKISSSLGTLLGTYVYPPILESKVLFGRVGMVCAVFVVCAYAAALEAGRRLLRDSWRPAVSYASMSVVLMSPLIEYHHLTWTILAWLLLVVDYAEGRVRNRFFWISAVFWVFIFYCRYWSELTARYLVHPHHSGTLALLALWVGTGVVIARRSVLSRVAASPSLQKEGGSAPRAC